MQELNAFQFIFCSCSLFYRVLVVIPFWRPLAVIM
nr:MAG TPA: hypothetical protein [Caudoviricetes sp.]